MSLCVPVLAARSILLPSLDPFISFLNHQALKYHSASPQPMGLPLSLVQGQLSFHSGTRLLIPGPALPALLPGVSVSHILELLNHASNFLIFTFSLSSCLIMFCGRLAQLLCSTF